MARLTEVHRQAGSSWIVRAAHAVNHGESRSRRPPGARATSTSSRPTTRRPIIGVIKQMVTDRIPAKFGLDPFRDVQVLTPQVKTELGVTNLNRELQSALNPGSGKSEVKTVRHRVPRRRQGDAGAEQLHARGVQRRHRPRHAHRRRRADC